MLDGVLTKPENGELDSNTIRSLMNEMGRELASRGEVAEIAIYGGAALLLLFNKRKMTKDVDFMLIEGHLDELIDVSETVGAKNTLPKGWFNDAVQFFINDHQELVSYGDFPVIGPTGLRVFLATPEYLLGMKMLAMRNPLESHDLNDIWNLMKACEIETLDDAKNLFQKYFPGDEISERNEALLEDLISDQAAGNHYAPINYW